MKRLSVRLSIVGAVLALGAAAIAHSVLSDNGEAPANGDETGALAAAEPSDAGPPSPIRVERDASPGSSPAEDALQPPPSSFFEGSDALRTVSHESASDDAEPTKSATAIPTADPTVTGGGFPLGQPPADPNYAVTPAFPESGATASMPDGSSTATGTGQEPEASGFPVAGSGDLPAASPAAPPSSSFSTGGLRTPLADRGASATTANPALADDTQNGFRTAGDLGVPDASPMQPAAALAAGVAGGVAGATLASGLPDTRLPDPRLPDPQESPQPSSESELPTAGGYPSTGANTLPGTLPTSVHGAASTTPSSNMLPAALSTRSAGGYTTSDPGRGLPPSATYPSAATAPGAAAGGPAALLASNLPGDRQLEGEQTPAIVIEKSAPEEIQVNRQTTFQLRVRNNGNAPAHNVVVIDRVPSGTKFVDATPPVTPTADGTLVWRIDVVKPGDEAVLSMNLLPQVAGEIGSVAQATFQAQASVRTICTKPELKLDITVAEHVLVGQSASLEITVTNIGNGAAEKVVIEEDVPEGFTHAAGSELEHDLGTLQPQESRRLTLVLDSVKPGDFQNRLTVRGEGDLFAEDVRPIRVTSPQLKVTMQGPSLRYLDRKATYTVHLANPGTASARNVELVTYLPKGMKYVTSDNHGQYDSQSHAVYWSLEEMPADKEGDVHVTVLPLEPGEQKLKTDVRANLGLQVVCEHKVSVEGLAELSFVVSDVADPIEVGSETTYEIKVQNRGSKADTEIQLVAELPVGITPIRGDGPTQGTVQGQSVVFGPLARLGPQEEAVFRIHARGAVIGDHVMRAQLRSAELRVAVTKEEITRVYTDN